MDINKAVEILNDWGVISEPQVDQDLLDAVKLGIEALKWLQYRRAKGYDYLGHLLPSENQVTFFRGGVDKLP